MNNASHKRTATALAVLVALLVLAFVFGNLFSSEGSQARSVELGVSSVSPRGNAGGAVIPASCGSPHSGDLCTPPTFTAESETINVGDSTTLTWSCVDSSSSSGVNFSTGGAVSGSTGVSPAETTTYTVICSNGGQDSVTVTVLNPDLSITASPALLQSGSTSTVTWSASSVNSCTVTENSSAINDSFSGTSGSQTTSPIVEETTYTLTCQTDGGSTSASAIIRIIPIFQEF